MPRKNQPAASSFPTPSRKSEELLIMKETDVMGVIEGAIASKKAA